MKDHGTRSITHGVIYALLIFMLLMCGVFFWGAFNNHRITLHNIQEECQSVLEAATGKDAKLVETRIKSLEKIQKDLFETNTISFFFNLFMIIIVTVGGYILSTTLRNQKEAENTADNMRKGLGGFVGSLRTELQLQCSLWELHGLCMNMPDNAYRRIIDVLTMINNDCSLMPISEIGMSNEVCRRNSGMVDEIWVILENAQLIDDPVLNRLEDLKLFLEDNQGRFAARWNKYCKDLEIESIDIRDASA